MALILDTNAISDYAKGNLGLNAIIDSDPDILVPAIVVGEYLYGIAGSSKKDAIESWFASVLERFQVAEVTASTAEYYASVRSKLKSQGTPIPENDVWIAATALHLGAKLVSRDKHFDYVDGLTRLSWND